jgi:hypothetical protein
MMLAPNTTYPMFIVAPVLERKRVREQLLRPAYRRLGLRDKVTFLRCEPVDDIDEFFADSSSGLSVGLTSGEAEVRIRRLLRSTTPATAKQVGRAAVADASSLPPGRWVSQDGLGQCIHAAGQLREDRLVAGLSQEPTPSGEGVHTCEYVRRDRQTAWRFVASHREGKPVGLMRRDRLTGSHTG